VPSSAEILAGAARAARESIAFAAVWHLVLLAAAIALSRGLRPSRRAAGLAIAVLLLSPAAVAFHFGNPFNSAVLAFAGGVLSAVALRLGLAPVERGAPWSRTAGFLLVALGWFYPHFLEDPALYAAAAPLGVLPCPTLCAAAGITLFANGFSSRAWTLALAVFAAFYGAVGAFRLGVWIDLLLLAGAVALVVLAFRDVSKRVDRGALVGIKNGEPRAGRGSPCSSTAPAPPRPPPGLSASPPAPRWPLRGDVR
jgi:hypothetical protein